MDSQQLFSPSFPSSSPLKEPMAQKPDMSTAKSAPFSDAVPRPKETRARNPDGYVGVLDVHIHQARDIHNICIYHKQDVYAKLCLTSDSEVTVSTQTINGGGKNPVFNESLQLKVQTLDSSLKCEIWMLSRVRNYLEDQLLGFALVPLSEVVVGDGKLMQEFSLSSNDLFHSPAGFVQLSLSYSGSSPEVMVISGPPAPVAQDANSVDTGEEGSPLPSEYTKIEFPDPKIVNENQIMVSEYIGIPCSELDSQSPESLVTTETGDTLSEEIGVQVVECFANEALKDDASLTSASVNGLTTSPSTVAPITPQSVSDTEDQGSSKKEESADAVDREVSSGPARGVFPQPVINIKIEPEQPVVQQDIVDMYMKSMQQFTESLANMKLPMDVGNGASASENGSPGSDSKLQQKGPGSRVFYGSRAFF